MKEYFNNKTLLRDLYKTYLNTSLSLNDHLAAIRSILANERTFLSYQRSALTLLLAGFTIIKFAGIFWMQMVGVAFIPLAIITGIVGLIRYRRMRNLIFKLESVTIRHYNMKSKF